MSRIVVLVKERYSLTTHQKTKLRANFGKIMPSVCKLRKKTQNTNVCDACKNRCHDPNTNLLTRVIQCSESIPNAWHSNSVNVHIFFSSTITQLTVLVAPIYFISFCQKSFNLEPKRVKSCQSWCSVITELSVKRLQINRIHSVCKFRVSKWKFGRIANELSVKWGGLDQSLFQMT